MVVASLASFSCLAPFVGAQARRPRVQWRGNAALDDLRKSVLLVGNGGVEYVCSSCLKTYCCHECCHSLLQILNQVETDNGIGRPYAGHLRPAPALEQASNWW